MKIYDQMQPLMYFILLDFVFHKKIEFMMIFFLKKNIFLKFGLIAKFTMKHSLFCKFYHPSFQFLWILLSLTNNWWFWLLTLVVIIIDVKSDFLHRLKSQPMYKVTFLYWLYLQSMYKNIEKWLFTLFGYQRDGKIHKSQKLGW